MSSTKSLKKTIRNTGIASITGLKKHELVSLRNKVRKYDETNQNPLPETYEKITFNPYYKDEDKIRAGIIPKNVGYKTITLTPEQINIVTSDTDQHHKIIACAGSGKTTTILCRIKYLIDKGVKPWQIMLTTFNVDAAENMRMRICELFGFKVNVYIGTIDALAYRFYNAYFKRPDFIGVTEYCTEFLKFLISDSEKATKLKNRIEYVFFDEFQDCNDVQFEIIKEFAKTARVTVIGDDAQNIYQWRGSNMDFILNFENYISCIDNPKINNITKCKVLTLKNNFRSTPEIINLANASIKNNSDQIPKDMIPINKSYDRLPCVYRYQNEEEQAKYTLAYILRYVKNNIPLDQIAVLSRNNYSLNYLEEIIEKHNINNDNEIKYVSLISDDTKDTKPKIMKDHVTLTTIHKSKGLEWDVVFILSCNDDKFPSETTPMKLQEDRRLFYVAVTRAKRYLNISFTSKSITRYIGELDRSLYKFDKYDPMFFTYNDDRNIKFKNGVTQLIELIEPRDIEDMRLNGIIPPIIPYTHDVHDKHTYSDFIDKYYLQSDYGTYIDRYVSRRFGIVCPSSGGLIDTMANKVLNTITLSKQLQECYNIYNYNIQRKLDLIFESVISSQKLSNTNKTKYYLNDIINNIDQNPNDPLYIKPIDDKDKPVLKTLIDMMFNRSIEINVYPSQLHIAPSNYMPHEYKAKFDDAYQRFRKIDGDRNPIDVRKDVYAISLCQNIYDGRRRLLYKDCFDKFDTDVSLYADIDNWVKTFRNRKITSKCCLIHKKLGICGEIDLLDLTPGTECIIDIKCSLNSECKLEWIIQLLLYSSLYKYVYGKTINHLGIYNPLRGTYTDVDVDGWDKHDELLIYMDKIRTLRMMNK